RADHLEARAITGVREARIAMAAEVTLADQAVLRAIEHRTPLLELADALRRLPRVQLGHAPDVEELAAAHRVAEVDLPVVARVDVAHRRGHAAFGHHGVRLAEQALGDHARRQLLRAAFDRGAQACATGADDEDIVSDRLNFGCVEGHVSTTRY